MKLIWFIPLALLVAGCASGPRDSGFAEVQRDVAHRSGQQIRWNTNSADDRAAEASVDQLLAQGLTADRAVQIALLNNRHLQATYQSLGVAQAQLVQAGLLKNPIFAGDVKFPEGGQGTHLELSVVANFLDVLFIPLRKQIAESNFEVAKLGVTGSVLEFAADTRTSFYEAQAAQQTVELRQKIVEAMNASTDLGQRLRKAGNITELDAMTHRAAEAQAKLDLADAQAAAVAARERLNVALGLSGTRTTWKLSTSAPDLPEKEQPVDDVEPRAVASSIALAANRLEIERLGKSLGLAGSKALLPDVQLGAAYERDPDGTDEFGPAFSVPIPLFDLGQASRASAAAELQRSREQYSATAVDVQSAARLARSRVIIAREKALHLRDDLLPLRQKITSEMMLHYNAMSATPFQLLEAKQAELGTNIKYVEAVRDYWIARAELDELLSGRMIRSSTSMTGAP